MCVWRRAGTCTAKKETSPPTQRHALIPLNANHPGHHEPPPSPPPSLPLAQRLTRGYCGLKQRKSTLKNIPTHTRNTVLTDKLLAPGWTRQTKRCIFGFWEVSVGTRGAQQERRGGQKKRILLPLCTECWERCRISKMIPRLKRYSTISTPSLRCMILCKWAAHLSYDHPCTSSAFRSALFGLLQTLMLWNNEALLCVCLILWFEGCTGIHGLLFCASSPIG